MSAFQGGEKKRNEMVQMALIDPKLAVLDETDSGLDIDALRVVGEGINRIMRRPDKAVILITHYQRLLDIVAPDFVHVLAEAASSAPAARTRARAGARRLCAGGGVKTAHFLPFPPVGGRWPEGSDGGCAPQERALAMRAHPLPAPPHKGEGK
jgi:ABC-type taurine transport system ATPase subunit